MNHRRATNEEIQKGENLYLLDTDGLIKGKNKIKGIAIFGELKPDKLEKIAMLLNDGRAIFAEPSEIDNIYISVYPKPTVGQLLEENVLLEVLYDTTSNYNSGLCKWLQVDDYHCWKGSSEDLTERATTVTFMYGGIRKYKTVMPDVLRVVGVRCKVEEKEEMTIKKCIDAVMDKYPDAESKTYKIGEGEYYKSICVNGYDSIGSGMNEDEAWRDAYENVFNGKKD